MRVRYMIEAIEHEQVKGPVLLHREGKKWTTLYHEAKFFPNEQLVQDTLPNFLPEGASHPQMTIVIQEN